MKCVVSYAMRYYGCLLKGDFSELSNLSVSKRRHVLVALANLSKFLGLHEDFKKLVNAHGLKGETVKAEDLLLSRMARANENGQVTTWIAQVKAMLPEIATFPDFALASGLRYVEALNSYNLIIDLARARRLGEYFNSEREVLEHIRFKQLFLRHTKKVFISFVPRQLVEQISREKPLTDAQVRLPLQRKGFSLRFSDIREFYATHMTKWLTQPEIDFLEGRVSASVFMKHYFNPALIGDLKARVFKGIVNL